MKEFNLPIPDKNDKLENTLKKVIETFPTGIIWTQIIDKIWQPAIDKRFEQWTMDVSNSINQLEIAFDELSKNDRFITCLTQAQQIAIRNHDVIKLEYIKNAVLNSVNEPTYPDSMQITFLNLIDIFTPFHIKFLIFFQNLEYEKYRGKSYTEDLFLIKMMQEEFIELANQRDFVEKIFKDLYAHSLINFRWEKAMNFNIEANGKDVSKIICTNLGSDFISFLSRKI